MNSNNKSPLRYPGGKTRACKILDDVLQRHFQIDEYNNLASPFFGGGSFEFYFQNKYKKPLIVNDKFTPLYNFWQQVKCDRTELCKRLRQITNVTKEDFSNYRSSIISLDNEVLKQATQYFVINRCSFSGATLSGGFSQEASLKRFTPSSIDRIEQLDLSNITIYNLDFAEFINKHIDEKSLLFLDPPYYLEKSNLYGNNGDMHEKFDHEQLFNTIRDKPNWLITYNNCEYIKKMYKDYTIIPVSWSYGMNSSKASSEIIIISKLV